MWAETVAHREKMGLPALMLLDNEELLLEVGTPLRFARQ